LNLFTKQEKGRIMKKSSYKPATKQSDISVVICAYTEKRWDDLVAAVASLQQQSLQPCETLVVIDHNPSLLEKAHTEFNPACNPGYSEVIVLENREARGLSGARNSGIAAAKGTIVAFLDDDAVAATDWLMHLAAGYTEPQIVGVGGSIDPHWETGRPAWFPREFDWVVGCTYRGMPWQPKAVRNLIGANMSFRREVFAAVGGFRTGVGQVGASMLRCDDTEFCIRVGQQWPNAQLLYMPQALVYHHVPAERATWRYFYTRCYTEGLAKALVATLVGTQAGLSAEWDYTLRTLPTGVLKGLRDFERYLDGTGLARAAAILAGLSLTTTGYLIGQLTEWMKGWRHLVSRSAQPWQREEPAL
jgi:glucosyl-dolichyl phosphate glucuronosyltransferase